MLKFSCYKEFLPFCHIGWIKTACHDQQCNVMHCCHDQQCNSRQCIIDFKALYYPAMEDRAESLLVVNQSCCEVLFSDFEYCL